MVIPNISLCYFVRYLRGYKPLTYHKHILCAISKLSTSFWKNNVCILQQIVQGTQKWHWNFSIRGLWTYFFSVHCKKEPCDALFWINNSLNWYYIFVIELVMDTLERFQLLKTLSSWRTRLIKLLVSIPQQDWCFIAPYFNMIWIPVIWQASGTIGLL